MKELNEIYELLSDAYAEIDMEKQRLIRCKNNTANIKEQIVYTAQLVAHAEDQCKINKVKHAVEMMIIRLSTDPAEDLAMIKAMEDIK